MARPPHRPWLYLIAGPNGSGKSTIAPHVLGRFDPPLPFVNVDDIARDLAPNDVAGVSVEAGRIAIQCMSTLLETGASFALETTLSGSLQIGLAQRAKRRGWGVDLTFVFLRSPETNVARVATRVAAGGHDVARADIMRRHRRSLENLWKLLHLCDRWAVLENSELRPRLVAAGAAKEAVIDDHETFHWLEGFRKTPQGR